MVKLLGSTLLIIISVLYTSAAVFDRYRAGKWFKTPRNTGHIAKINGRRIYYTIKGKGSPAVIIEPGLGVPSPEWWHIQDELAKVTTVLTYDRAGYGWSETGPSPRTSRAVAEELHQLLTYLGIEGPFIFVGHSQGGLYVNQYGRLFPQDMAGAVFLDPLSPEDFRFKAELPEKVYRGSGVDKMPGIKTIQVLGSLRLLRTLKPMLMKSPPFYYYGKLSPEIREVLWQHLQKRETLETVISEYQEVHREGYNAELERSGSFPAAPVKVLYHTPQVIVDEIIKYGGLSSEEAWQVENLWRELVYRYTRLSPDSHWEVAENSGHGLHLAEPEFVIGQIKELLSTQL